MLHKRITFSNDPRVHMDTYFIEHYKQTNYKNGEWQQNPRPVFLILPGGSYAFHSEREAEPIALAFNAHGFHCAILYYSVLETSRMPRPLEDVSLAIWHLRSHAKEYYIDPNRIIVGGFSAGGNLAAIIGTQWNTPGLCTRLKIPESGNQPNALMLAYAPTTFRSLKPVCDELLCSEPVGSAFSEPTEEVDTVAHISQQTPPCFIWTTGQDQLVDPRHSLLFASACAEKGVDFELHYFQFGLHGLALANDNTDFGVTKEPNVELWVPMFVNWLSRIFS